MTRLLFFILFSSTAFAQVTVSIDKFDAPNSFYTSFTQGSGSTNLSANNIDYVSGAASLQINYTFNAGSNYFFTVLKNYSTTVKDWSFNTTGFSLRHKGGNNQSILKFRLWEDINRNGSNDNEDEVYMCSTAINAGSSTWVTSNFDLANFIKITGNGNGILDLNRIRAWDIVIENSGINASNGIILLDELLLNSSYTAPADNGAKLSGSFVQLWNSAGCACGQWTTQQWKDQFQKMKDACMTTFVVQYSVYNDLSWYSPSNISNVLYKENALNKIFEAAEEKGIQVYTGLYFDEHWNSDNKSSGSTYFTLLSKHQQVIDEIYGLFGNSIAFKGWYIPQEINDLEWQNEPQKTMLFNWVQSVASYAHSKDQNKKVMIAPFFNLWIPADLLENWYNDFLSTATDLDQIFPQDGVGITLKNVYYDVPLFYAKIKEACDNHGVEFGATIESFQQLSGWPIDNGNFSAQSANINRLKSQLWEAQLHVPVEIIQFEWAYMQGNLYQDYLSYSNCTTNNIIEKENESQLFSLQNEKVSFFLNVNEVTIYDGVGNEILKYGEVSEVDLSKFSSGLYLLKYAVGKEKFTVKIIK